MPHTTNFTFTWPAGPNDVIVTGTFDDWKGSIPLVKTSSGSFEISVPFTEPPENEDDRIYFKFIVDGDWTVSDEYEKASDGCGFENNYIHIRDIIAADKLNKSGVKIPEAGGLPAATTTLNTTTNTTTATGNNRNDSNNGTVHILPITQPHNNNNNQNTFTETIGGPGPVILENAQDIKEFSDIRDVDANELNDRLNKELKNKKKSENSNRQELNTNQDSSLVDTTKNPSDMINKEQNGDINENSNKYSRNIDKHDDIDQLDDSNVNGLKSQLRKSTEAPHASEAKIPMVKSKETEKSDKESEPTPLQKDAVKKTCDNPKTNNTKVEGNTKNVENDTSNIKTAKMTDSSESKTNEEQKKPKKGFFGRLKRIFT